MKEKELKISVLDDDRSVYHYTSASALMNLIKTNEFWVTDARYLNDYTETIYIQEILEEVCKEIMNGWEKGKLLYDRIMEEYIKYEKLSPAYVLSFSVNNDSITLWSEFSDFYGYNLEFNIHDLRKRIFYNKNNYDDIIQEGEVIYDKKKQIEIIKSELLDLWYIKSDEEVIDEKLAFIKQNNPSTNIDDLKERLMNPIRLERIFDEEYRDKLNEYVGNFGCMAIKLYVYAPFFKKNCFKDEHEYRFVFLKEFDSEPSSDNSLYKDGVSFREKDGVIIPYIKVKLNNCNEKIPIKSVLVGAKNNSDVAVKGTRYYLDNYNYSETKVSKSEITLRY